MSWRTGFNAATALMPWRTIAVQDGVWVSVYAAFCERRLGEVTFQANSRRTVGRRTSIRRQFGFARAGRPALPPYLPSFQRATDGQRPPALLHHCPARPISDDPSRFLSPQSAVPNLYPYYLLYAKAIAVVKFVV